MSKSRIDQKPSLKAGVRVWRSRYTLELRVGTSQRNFAFPNQIREIDSEALLKILDGRRTVEALVALSGISLPDLEIFFSLLEKERLLDWQRPNLEMESEKTSSSAHHSRSKREVGESIDSNSLRTRRLLIESDSVTFRKDNLDGGFASVLRRKNFAILVFHTNRLAISIAGALKSAGFEDLRVIDRSPKNHRSRYVQNEDLNGGFFRGSEILHLKEPLIEELSSFGRVQTPVNTYRPDLIISAAAPSFDAEQRWLSEGTPHLIVDYENSAEVRIGPLVIPGQTPCLGCLEISEVESGNALPLRESIKEYELSSGLALYAAGLVTLLVNEFADTGASPFSTQTVELSSHDYLITQIRNWSPHPKCGCSAK